MHSHSQANYAMPKMLKSARLSLYFVLVGSDAPVNTTQKRELASEKNQACSRRYRNHRRKQVNLPRKILCRVFLIEEIISIYLFCKTANKRCRNQQWKQKKKLQNISNWYEIILHDETINHEARIAIKRGLRILNQSLLLMRQSFLPKNSPDFGRAARPESDKSDIWSRPPLR